MVTIGDVESGINLLSGVGGFIFGLYALLDERRKAPVISQDQLAVWLDHLKRRSETEFVPYPEPDGDGAGNTRREVSRLFWTLTLGTWVFAVGTTVWGTLLFVPLLYAAAVPGVYSSGITEIGTVSGVVGLSGAFTTFYAVRELSKPSRRHIIAFMALVMGKRLKITSPPSQVAVLIDPTDPKVREFIAGRKRRRRSQPRQRDRQDRTRPPRGANGSHGFRGR